MAIKFKVIERGQPGITGGGEKKYYASPVTNGELDISNPFYSTISRIIEDRANEFNYTVLFSSSDEDLSSTKRLINVLINKGNDNKKGNRLFKQKVMHGMKSSVGSLRLRARLHYVENTQGSDL